MAQLAEAYIHLRPFKIREREARELGRYVNRLAIRTASRIYDERIAVDVEMEEGSLKTWVTISGILVGLYTGIANYKGFREGVVLLCDDARRFAVDVCKPFVQKAGASEHQVYRFERRLKTPGRIYRLTKRLEQLEKYAGQISAMDMQRELFRSRRDLEAIEADLSPAEREEIEQRLRTERLPNPSNWPEEEPTGMPRLAIKEEHEQPSLFDPSLGFTLPARDQEPHTPTTRLVYRNRTIIEAKAPRLRKLKRDLPAITHY